MESIVIDGNEYQCTLIDEGSMDTVIEVYDVTTRKTDVVRFAGCTAAEYRDEEGELDLERFVAEVVGPAAAQQDWDGMPPGATDSDDDWTDEQILDRAVDDDA